MFGNMCSAVNGRCKIKESLINLRLSLVSQQKSSLNLTPIQRFQLLQCYLDQLLTTILHSLTAILRVAFVVYSG